jgi:hypothetical protein
MTGLTMGRYNTDRRRKKPSEEEADPRHLPKEEYSGYHETTSRNI